MIPPGLSYWVHISFLNVTVGVRPLCRRRISVLIDMFYFHKGLSGDLIFRRTRFITLSHMAIMRPLFYREKSMDYACEKRLNGTKHSYVVVSVVSGNQLRL